MSSIRPYAGFWKRFAAYLIDAVVVAIPLLLLAIPALVYFISSSGNLESADTAARIAFEVRFRQIASLFQVVFTLAPWFYGAWMESSRLQATVGKMLLGIKVVNAQGGRLTFWHAFGRNAGKAISGLILNIGFLMAGATRKKQALHDKMTNAYVVENDFQPGDELPEVKTHFGILGSVIGVMVLGIMLFIGLLVGLIVYAVQHSEAPRPSPTTQGQLILNK